jgi:GNAT superfamily N-acetyltransferase
MAAAPTLSALPPALLHDLSRQERAALSDMFEAARAAGFVPGDRAALDDGSTVICLIDGGWKIRAAASFFPVDQARCWLDFLYVDPELRGRGHGRALLERVRHVCAAQGCRRLMLGTSVDNDRVRKLARTAGFDETAIHYSIAIGD